MERPTCKTCPYWKKYSTKTQSEQDDGLFEDVKLGDALRGHCQANPPSVFMEATSDIDECEAVFPLTWFDISCGRHPDFPAYIASLKTSTNESRELLKAVHEQASKPID